MIRWISIGVLALALTGTAIWGYHENKEKNAILLQAENNYQRSFHELTYRMDTLHDKIGATLAMNSRASLSPQLAEIWRVTSEAHTDVGQLPLALLPFNKTEDFLTSIGDFTYKTAVRDLDKEPLTDDELHKLESLYSQAGDIKDELREVQNMVLGNNLRWMDVELALATNESQEDNTIIDGFKTVEKTAEGMSDEAGFNNGALPSSNEEHKFEGLTGAEISKKEAQAKTREIFSLNNNTELTVTKSGEGSDVPLYSTSFESDGKHGYMDLSQQGGHILSLMLRREMGDIKIGLNEAQKKAEEFLKSQELDNMEMVSSSQYDSVGVFFYVPTQEKVRIYADLTEVKVGLDDGEILGYNSRDYFMNHHERKINDPKLTAEEAKTKVNPNVQIQEERMAVIENDAGEEVLVYEFLGTLGDDTYRIYINADSGEEEEIEKQTTTEAKFAEST